MSAPALQHQPTPQPPPTRPWSAEERALGMDRRISRRDMLHGLAGIGSGCLLPAWAGWPAAPAAAAAPDMAAIDPTYPPRWTGLRGSTDESFATAHALRDGASWPEVSPTEAVYDLVVVGAGISGLAAAHYYRARIGAHARILILDNHDDFGGHARRNEFYLEGKLHLLNGGTAEIDSPRPYSADADSLLRTLGLDVDKLAAQVPNPEFFRVPDTERGVFFSRELFGTDKLVAGRGGRTWLDLLDEAPLNAAARADIRRLETQAMDYLPGRTSAEKKALLATISYQSFLRDYVKVDPQVLAFYDDRTNGEFGVGIDAVSALDCWGVGGDQTPGMAGLKLAPGGTSRMGYTPAGYASTGGSYQLHFPDGNATIARLLVRALIPGVAPAGGVEQILTAHFDYTRLDEANSPVRLRLRSTAVRVRNIAAVAGSSGAGDGVVVSYVRGGDTLSVRARHAVLACYNAVIPYLCAELPTAQKAALHELVKSPLLYTSVAIRNALALHARGLRRIDAPGCYHPALWRNPYMALGRYRGPASAAEPTLLHMQRTPCKPGLTEQDQNRAGRAELLATPFASMEFKVRDQLARMLGPDGFDPARDILAITVNRWPHGYAPEFNSLFDRELPLEQQPHVVGRTRCGQIAIANSDAGRAAYTDIAIDQAYRAVRDLLG